jgi:hypothetical protein
MSNQVGNPHDSLDVTLPIDHRDAANLMFRHSRQDFSDVGVRSTGDRIGRHAVLNRG